MTVWEDMKIEIVNRIKEIKDEILADFHRKVFDTIKTLGGDQTNLNGSRSTELWKILKRRVPKNAPIVPVGKKDKSGNLITNFEGLKSLYLKTYIDRMRERPIKDEYKDIKELKEELFEIRLHISKCNESEPWTMEELVTCLNELKGGRPEIPMRGMFENINVKTFQQNEN